MKTYFRNIVESPVGLGGLIAKAILAKTYDTNVSEVIVKDGSVIFILNGSNVVIPATLESFRMIQKISFIKEIEDIK